MSLLQWLKELVLASQQPPRRTLTSGRSHLQHREAITLETNVTGAEHQTIQSGEPLRVQNQSNCVDAQKDVEESRLNTPSDVENGKAFKNGRVNTGYTAIRSLLTVVDRASGAFPPLKGIAGSINAILDVSEAFSSNQQDFDKLAERVKLLDDILSSRPNEELPRNIQDRRDGLKRSIEVLGNSLHEKIHRTGLKKVVYAKEDQQDIIRLVREVTFAIELAMFDVTIHNGTMTLKAVAGIDWLTDHTKNEYRAVSSSVTEIVKVVDSMKKDVYLELLKRLGKAKRFAFTRGGRRSGCIPGSRITLLSQLMAWAEDSGSKHVFWLSGGAGAGKTAICETFCMELSKRGMLGASFFCSMIDQDLSDVYNIIPSLAKALAKLRPRFGDAIATILDELSGDMDPLEMSFEEQYDYLILRPASQAFHDETKPVVLCVDALDECQGSRALKQILDTIVLTNPPTAIKFFLTSRPEHSITERMESPEYFTLQQRLRLQDIEHDDVRHDIHLYIHRALERIDILRRHYGAAWPPPEAQRIVDRSGTLFIVAATYVRYIDSDYGNRIERFISCCAHDFPHQSGIAPLYTGILEKAFASLIPREEEDMKACLSLLVAAQRPLMLLEYSALLDRPEWVIKEAFKPLYSVVDIDEAGHVSVYHSSFTELLTTPRLPSLNYTEPRQPVWAIDPRKAHQILGRQCLSLMDSRNREKGIDFGVSGTTTSYRSNDNQPSEIKLRSDLAYACSEWGAHILRALPVDEEMENTIKSFLEAKAVSWIEALGVEKKVGSRSTNVLLELSKGVRDTRLSKLMSELQEFAGKFSTPINYSTPHLYLSVLPFLHLLMDTSAWHPPHIPSIPLVNVIADSNNPGNASEWEIVVASVRLASMAVSPDGSRLASGSDQGEVELWDARSGERIMVLGGKTGVTVASVAFSSDNSRMVSASGKSITIWDGLEGELVSSSLEGHTDAVRSVAFSPDGTRIASGSDDHTFRLWDTHNGAHSLNILEGHTDSVVSVSFSPDGQRAISGSLDGAIRVWHTQTGMLAMAPLVGHKSAIGCVTFSPCGSRIISSSQDMTIRVWDALSGQLAMQLEGHSNWVTSLTMSPDGRYIASGSLNMEVRVWDAETGELTASTVQAQGKPICDLAFSPDGSRLYSGSVNDTIRVWDIHSTSHEKAKIPVFQGSADAINTVAFYPDGSKVASGSTGINPRALRVWDRHTGRVVFDPVEPRGGFVFGLSVSPDGSAIACGSQGDTIEIVDARSGKHIKNISEGREGDEGVDSSLLVKVVAFSPDGTKVAFKSHPNTISVWNARDGTPVTGTITIGAAPNPDRPYYALNHPLTFSPDGSKIVTGTGDESSILVLDASSGEQVLDPIEGHTDYITAVAFSPDGSKIASGSYDKTVRIWDAKTGASLMDPLVGHTTIVNCVAFSPDGSKIISGSNDRAVRVWDAGSGRVLMGPLVGHTERVRSVAFSPGGSEFVSGSWDGTIRVWDALDAQTASPATYLHHYSHRAISMGEDGWICNTSGELLLWVPPQLRPWIHVQPLRRLIAGPMIEIDLSRARYHGFNWLKCKDPLPQHIDANYGTPWPVNL